MRVTAPDYDLRRATGQVMRLTTDSITIDRDGRPAAVTIPIDGLSRLEVSTVKRPGLGFVKAAGAGFAIGTLAGLAFGALQYATCSKDECVLWFLITVPIGAGAGLVVGSIVGLARAADRWEEVPLTRRSGESGMAGQHRTAKIGFSIAF